MATLGSVYDLRQPWQIDKLYKAIRDGLTKGGESTRNIATQAGCTIPQARYTLNRLWDDGHAVPSGDKRVRLWHKT